MGMPAIFDFLSYRQYLEAWITAHGPRGYGLKGKISQALGVSSSLFSQILKEEKSLTPDQACDLGEYLHLLVEHSRAGTKKYQDKLLRKIQNLQEQSKKIGRRVPRSKELSEEQKAIYYSSWLYTGIRNMVAIPKFDNVQGIAERFDLDVHVVQKMILFLVDNGLCVSEAGKISYGPASTHVDKESPFVNQHHHNWRLQALRKMESRRPRDVFFTSPMSLSIEAAAIIQKMIPQFIQEVMKISGPSNSETVSCLNIDWFEY
jgi:uncharacterized protein (TIGR02147 family)